MIVKYVDDFLGVEKMCLSDGVLHFSVAKTRLTIRARMSEDFFNTVSANAQNIGMSVNGKKTQLMCISAAQARSTSSFIVTMNGEIHSQERMKILGFTFSSRPNASAHVEEIAKKFKSRLWLLRKLRKARIT